MFGYLFPLRDVPILATTPMSFCVYFVHYYSIIKDLPEIKFTNKIQINVPYTIYIFYHLKNE